MSEVRTRFAPSPTGFLHIGNIRTAIFAWLTARHYNGQFILRIEDTDQNRYVEGSIDYILNIFKILDITYDEGPNINGPFGPYVQSQRLDIYYKWANILTSSKRAYVDPYSKEELQGFRDAAIASKKPFLFRNHRPVNPDYNFKTGQPLRFLSEPKSYSWHDEVMGDLSTGEVAVDDFILIKSDGYPTYNFAHIVDDFEMKISHIVRGQEFISSSSNYLNLYEALKITPPLIATVPHILDASGNKKLGKRNNDLDTSLNVVNLINDGFLQVPLINYITSLGWNDGSTDELFSIKQLFEKFTLDRIQRSGAKYDFQRLVWLNGLYIRSLDLDKLFVMAKDYWPTEANHFDDNYKKQVLALLHERLKYLSEIPKQSLFFFTDLPIDPRLISEHKQLSKLPKEDLISMLNQTLTEFSSIDSFSNSIIVDSLNRLLELTNQKPMVLFSLIRIATTQAQFSPPLAPSLELLGKDKVTKRIKDMLDYLATLKS